jgi:muconate cycloisomerase
MKFTGIEIFHLRIPFRRSYRHALAEHTESQTVLVKVSTDSGTAGWGETIPREYLTGETPEGVRQFINERLWPPVMEREISAFEDVAVALEPLVELSQNERKTAAYCAFELALLDAAGKEFRRSAGDALGYAAPRSVRWTAPIDAVSPEKAARRAFVYRLLGFREFKLKVGRANDVEVVRAVRKIVGNKANIRVDANCAWDAATAIRNTQALAGLNVSSIEQPTPARDFDALAEVAARSPIPVMADESLCTTRDAEALAERAACQIFNVRLAKCGGLLGSKKIIEIARANKIAWQLGCLVGETPLLGAAEKLFLSRNDGFVHVEYPFSRQLLGASICRPPGRRVPAGKSRIAVKGIGLGVIVNEEMVRTLELSKR